MKINSEIETLLNRYWECDTDEKEEQRLRDFFLSCDTLPEKLSSLKPLFAYFRQQQTATRLSGDFDAKLMAKLQQQQQPKSKLPVWRWTLAAACIAAFVGIAYFVNYRNHELSESVKYAEMRTSVINALLLISDNLQKGETAVNEGLSQITGELEQINLLTKQIQ